jgi:hypothetical protein
MPKEDSGRQLNAFRKINKNKPGTSIRRKGAVPNGGLLLILWYLT